MRLVITFFHLFTIHSYLFTEICRPSDIGPGAAGEPVRTRPAATMGARHSAGRRQAATCRMMDPPAAVRYSAAP